MTEPVEPAESVKVPDDAPALNPAGVNASEGAPEGLTGRTDAQGEQAARPDTQPSCEGAVEQGASILLLTDDEEEAQRIVEMLGKLDYVARYAHFKQAVQSLVTPQLKLVFLVMHEVAEQGFGAVIKIKTAAPDLPLVAAGPFWTKSLVLKAVKYGACDILVTPASLAELQKKVQTHLIT